MHIDLLFQPKPRRAALVLLVTVLLAAAAWLASEAWRHQKAAELAEAKLRYLQMQKKKIVIPIPKPAELEATKRWNAMQAELAFEWYPIFRALEQANNSDIDLLEFQPDKFGRRFLLRGEARDQVALTNYVSALAGQSVFSELYLAHQKAVHKPGLDVLSFEIRTAIAN